MNISPEDIEIVSKAYSAGMTKNWIYRKYGIYPQKVMRIVAMKGITQGVHTRPLRMADKPKDLSQLIPVHIDHRTTIYARPGSDIDAVREKYLNHNKVKQA